MLCLARMVFLVVAVVIVVIVGRSRFVAFDFGARFVVVIFGAAFFERFDLRHLLSPSSSLRSLSSSSSARSSSSFLSSSSWSSSSSARAAASGRASGPSRCAKREAVRFKPMISPLLCERFQQRREGFVGCLHFIH
jgi:hypothetical protein